jgi:hypothetical protein
MLFVFMFLTSEKKRLLLHNGVHLNACCVGTVPQIFYICSVVKTINSKI